MRVRVLGSGVVGLSVAVRLAQAGHEVQVLTDRPVEQTTSAVAAALWYPYLAAPAERTRAWGARTYQVLLELAATTPEAGVDVRRGRELLACSTPLPDWHADVLDFTASEQEWSFHSPVADMARYLPWLAARAEAAGVRVRTVPTLQRAELDRVGAAADLLVLCPGLGARSLLDDDAVTPVRGQVVLVDQVGLEEWLLATADGPPGSLTYVVPRRESVVCGGTALPDRWDTDPELDTAAAVLERCCTLVPQLRGAAVLAHRVGLRPVRPSVRVELDDDSLGLPVPVVHCYGHGGAGVTLSWGCADEVAALAASVG